MGLLEIIVVVLVLLWLAGFSFHVGGAFVRLLLVIAVIVLFVRLIQGRRF